MYGMYLSVVAWNNKRKTYDELSLATTREVIVSSSTIFELFHIYFMMFDLVCLYEIYPSRDM